MSDLDMPAVAKALHLRPSGTEEKVVFNLPAVVAEVGRQLAEKLDSTTADLVEPAARLTSGIADSIREWTGASAFGVSSEGATA